jgi:hypothetical protein
MHTQRRYATCPQGVTMKKREREKKRCIHKEGMPHAHKACQRRKKRKKKKKEKKQEKNIAHIQGK